MRKFDPTNNVLPRWAMFLVVALPGVGTAATLVLLNVLDGGFGRIRLFNLSPKDTYLVAVIGAVLVSTVLGLLIYCLALMRALRRAVQQVDA
jgi:uncharacterized protein (DUF3084 family)